MNNLPILYVEDEENDVLLMRHAWKKAGLLNPLHVVADGEQAVKYLAAEAEYANRREHPMPTLVLMDLKLPKLNGLEVLKWIRVQPGIHLLPVIILSSSNKLEDICTAYKLRANAYLMKTAQADGLSQIIASLKDFWLGRVETPAECPSFPSRLSGGQSADEAGGFGEVAPR